MKDFLQIVLLLLAAVLASTALAQESAHSLAPPGADGFWHFTVVDQLPNQTVIGLDPLSPNYLTGPFQWSSFFGRRTYGPHELLLEGGLSTYGIPDAIGETQPPAVYQASAVYRYNGFLNGHVRPVARFTAGAGQGFSTGPFIATSPDFWAAWVVPEAGVEFVYKGYGIGVTGSMPIVVADPTWEDVLGGEPKNRQADWSKVIDMMMKNIYFFKE